MKKNAAFYAGIIIIVLMGINNRAGAQADSTASSDIYKQRLRRNKPLEDQLGYTQAIRTGNTVYISGTTAPGYMPDQLREIMNSIKSDLAKYGATMQNVVKQTIYTTDLDSFMINKVIMKSFYNGDYPTSSIVEVKRLLLPQFKVEIEIEAVLPNEQ